MSCDCNTLVIGEAGPQGPQGLAGTNGTNGTNGLNAFTTVQTSTFTQPEVNDQVVIRVGSNQWMGQGQAIYVSLAGYYVVDNLSGTDQITATLKAIDQVAVGGTVAIGTKVSPAAVATYAAPLDQLQVTGTSILDGSVYVNQSNNNCDTVIEGTTDPWLFVSDASANRVGVGVQVPEAKLHVSGTFKVGTLSSVSADAEFTRGATFNSLQGSVGYTATNFIVKTQNESDTFTVVAASNRVGIGTTTPGKLFDVDGTGQTKAWIINPGAASIIDSTPYVFRVYGSGGVSCLFVDASNNYVGVRNGAPSAPLHVTGSSKIDGNLVVSTSALIVQTSGNYVGVNTSSPTTHLHVNGSSIISGNLTVVSSANISGNLNTTGDINDAGSLVVSGSTTLNTLVATSSINIDSGTLYVDAASNRVGINTLSPASPLHVVGNAQISNRISSDELFVNTDTFVVAGSRVGVNISSPVQSFEVDGDSAFHGSLYVSTVFASAFTATTVAVDSVLSVTGSAIFDTNVFVVNATSNKVGVNVSSPTVSLDVSGDIQIQGTFRRGTPLTKTSDFTVDATENWIIVDNSGASTNVTLPAASSWTGREIMIKTIQSQTVVSVSSDVVPLNGSSPGTAILSATAGKWATLVSNGTNWVIMAGN